MSVGSVAAHCWRGGVIGRALARDALQLRRARHEQLGAAQLARARLGQQRELEQLWRLLGLAAAWAGGLNT